MIHHVEVQVLILLLVAAFVGMGARRFRLPYTLALVVAGLVLGGLDLDVLHDVELNADLLLLLLLPALLFEAAFHIDLAEFRRNLAPIVTLAVPGVMLASGASAGLLYLGLGATGLVEGFGWREAWLFSVVIAATDPVSVLALFKQFGVAKRLYLVVEGESLLNDGVAVVLFVIVTGVYGLSTGHNVMPEEASLLAYGLETLLRMGGGGALVGVALGGAFTVLTRQIDDHLIETTLTVLLAYGSFLVAEQLHCSGVLSTVFAGIVAGSYGASFGMSSSTHNAVEDFWELAGFLANSFIFLLVGLELEPWRLWHQGLAIVAAFVAIVIARAVAVYVGVPLANRFATPLPRVWSHVLVWGGLRGSLSMVLILTLPQSFPGRTLLVTLVFGVVGLSLFVQGLTMGPLLGRLGLLTGKQRHDVYEKARATSIMTRRALDELHELQRDGLVEPAVAERLRAWYTTRSERAEHEAKTALGTAQISEQLAEAVRRLAEAERRGVREAEHAEIIDVEVAQNLDRELVLRLLALDEAAEDGNQLQAVLDRLLAEEPSADAAEE
ncbi:cation:proton antiporter [Paraliomyxa miuraensis]|uniref:cation:proton antiporter n=1 Tax=Paraliomyxa miuraensis TaxID=376150 RepID=UPI002258F84A|nr:sodium:proton antiporter [Paraliomyxa miuraensis]MCX4247777.1 sodium:proton antiporter [Paraliomyxa miuraensis]